MNDVTQYIEQFPEEIQEILGKIRSVILVEVPEATEKIAYGIPAYYLQGKPLVYFAGYKNHIGFYATPNGHEEFAKEFSKYKQGKGSVQFPIKQEIPYELILKVVKFRRETISNNIKQTQTTSN